MDYCEEYTHGNGYCMRWDQCWFCDEYQRGSVKPHYPVPAKCNLPNYQLPYDNRPSGKWFGWLLVDIAHYPYTIKSFVEW